MHGCVYVYTLRVQSCKSITLTIRWSGRGKDRMNPEWFLSKSPKKKIRNGYINRQKITIYGTYMHIKNDHVGARGMRSAYTIKIVIWRKFCFYDFMKSFFLCFVLFIFLFSFFCLLISCLYSLVFPKMQLKSHGMESILCSVSNWNQIVLFILKLVWKRNIIRTGTLETYEWNIKVSIAPAKPTKRNQTPFNFRW